MSEPPGSRSSFTGFEHCSLQGLSSRSRPARQTPPTSRRHPDGWLDALVAVPEESTWVTNALLYQVATAVVTQVPEQELRRVEVVGLRQRLAELPSG